MLCLPAGKRGTVDATITEILSHIKNAEDRHTLNQLLRKCEVLRVRLLVKPPGLESDRAEIEELKRRLGIWEVWCEETTKQMRRLFAENRELKAKVASLEGRMQQLLREWNPPASRRLSQDPIEARRMGRRR